MEEAMILAGRTTSYPIFVAAFGDKDTDEMAYKDVGMDDSVLYMVNNELQQLINIADPTAIFHGYNDLKFVSSFFHQLKEWVPPERYGDKIDQVIDNLSI